MKYFTSHLLAKFWTAIWMVGLLGLSAFSVQAQSLVPANQQAWGHYVSDQFQVSSDVPTLGFSAPSQANDYGRNYLSDSGEVIVTVFAAYWNDNAAQFADYRRDQREKLEQIGAEITYAPGGNSWFVFSGFLGDDIFYFKATTRTNCPLAGHIYFKFPAHQKATMSPIIEHMEDTLRLNASDVCPA